MLCGALLKIKNYTSFNLNLLCSGWVGHTFTLHLKIVSYEKD